MKNIDEIIGKIQEKWGHQAIKNARYLSTDHKTYPSGFHALDALIGGIPRGQITELIGRPSSGMTTLAYRSLVLAQKQGANIVVIDSVGNLDIHAATEFGLDLEKIVLVESHEPHLLLNLLPELLNSGVVHYLLLNFTALAQTNVSLRSLRTVLTQSDCAVVLLMPKTSQTDIASLRLHIQRQRWLRLGTDIVGCLSSIRVEKQRFGKANTECLLILPFEKDLEL